MNQTKKLMNKGTNSIFMIFLGVLLYVEIVWQVESVSSAMEEECYGLKSMNRSHYLMKGISL